VVISLCYRNCFSVIVWEWWTVRGTYTHTHPFNGPFSGTTRVSRYHKGKTNLDFNEARDRKWQWHQLGHMQVCTWLQTDNHASTPPLSFLQAGCPSCRPTNSVKALYGEHLDWKSCLLLTLRLVLHRCTVDCFKVDCCSVDYWYLIFPVFALTLIVQC